jgi:hypothetical protein
MRVNFTERDTENNKFLPTGRSVVRIANVEETQSKSGNPMLVVTVEGVGRWSGREGKEYFPLSDKAKWKLSSLAQAVGYTPERLVAEGLDTNQLVGKTFEIEKNQTGVRMYEGKEQKEFETTYHRHDDATDPAGENDIPF